MVVIVVAVVGAATVVLLIACPLARRITIKGMAFGRATRKDHKAPLLLCLFVFFCSILEQNA